MSKIIKIDKIEIYCDLEDIYKNIQNWAYDKDLYTANGMNDICNKFSYSYNEWLTSKNNLLNKIEIISKNEDKLIELLKSKISINKNGTLSKNRRNIILEFDCVTDYNDFYGCHSFFINIIMVERISDYEGNLKISYYQGKNPF